MDQINSFFISVASIFYFLNLLKLYKDKDVKGISILSIIFFSTWNFWTLYFFWDTEYSLTKNAYIAVAASNILYLSLLFYYKVLDKD